jgi:hypothetical protein
MSAKRKLEVGPDGMANVLVLTDPIPRHVSIVDWGANNAPTSSWKSADASVLALASVLRSPPPAAVIDVSRVTLTVLDAFIAETLDAWSATVQSTLGTPLSTAERASRVRGLTAQAGARIAAAATAMTAQHASRVAKAHKVALLELPELPSAATVQGEIDRRHFASAMEKSVAALRDGVLALMASASSNDSLTDSILSLFAKAGDLFTGWAGSLPPGVVGVPTTSEKSMILTLAMLAAIAESDPKGFLEVIDNARKNLAGKDPKAVKKFAWGDTGVDQFDAEMFLGKLRDFNNGAMFDSMIASAIGGIDVEKAVASPMTVAASMKKVLPLVLAHELKSNPTGDLAIAVKTLIAPSVAKAIAESMKAAFQAGAPSGAGDFDFSADAGDDDPLTPVLPSLRG